MSHETLRRPLATTPLLDDHAGDTVRLRRVFAQFPSGVVAVSAMTDEGPAVLLASSFQVGISLAPPLVLFAVQHTSTSWPVLRDRPRLGVSVLAADQEEAALRLASSSARADRFTGLSTATTPSGAHLIDGASAWMECSVHSVTPAGDHDVVLLEVHAAGAAAPEVAPLVWHGSGFRTLAARSTTS